MPGAVAAGDALDVLRHLSTELRDLDVGTAVPRLPATSLGALHFLREFVGGSKPVVVTGAISHWPALTSWSEEQLKQVEGSTLVTVALTPNGRADCPTPLPGNGDTECFALPHQQRMPLAEFLDLLRASREDQTPLVPYYQYQNSCLTAELPQLMADVGPDLPFATDAFGAPPEAVNLWIGAAPSVTSWHRDLYENLYGIVSGSKTFRLLPPTESYRMALRRYPLATYRPAGSPATNIDGNSASLPTALEPVLEHPREEVLWSAITPQPSVSVGGVSSEADAATAALFEDPCLPRPLEVTIGPGEVLYLPACWWHEVHHGSGSAGDGAESAGIEGSSSPVIAVNYWYDMRFDAKYAFTKAAEALAERIGVNEAEAPSRDQTHP